MIGMYRILYSTLMNWIVKKIRHKKFQFLLLAGLVVALFLYIIYPSLNPFSTLMFDFHDNTQLARIDQYALNMRSGIFPPRIAPQVSFNLGWPIFNFYAPLAYIITALIHVIGIPLVSSLKLSFFLSFALSGIGMYVLLKKILSAIPAIVGTSIYLTSTYFATEIMIRGNLAEVWFAAIFPLTLYAILINSEERSRKSFSLAVILLTFSFLVHNLFSLIALALYLLFVYILPKGKRENYIAILISLFISSFFLIPAMLEKDMVGISSTITQYNFRDHFLCISQWWSSSTGWQFGPSLQGCDDAMSFKLGKLPLLFGFLGLALLISNSVFKREIIHKYGAVIKFFAVLLVFSLFLTLELSRPIWEALSPVMSYIQFPWRFMLLAQFGVGAMGAYVFARTPKRFAFFLALVVITLLFVPARKYMIKPMYSADEYVNKYSSKQYIEKEFSYMTPEYLSNKADPSFYQDYDIKKDDPKMIDAFINPIESENPYTITKNSFSEKEVKIEVPSLIKVNIHYLPLWTIAIDGKRIIPDTFDDWGRPMLEVEPSTITITYRQTRVERLANTISLLALCLFITMLLKNPFQKGKMEKNEKGS